MAEPDQRVPELVGGFDVRSLPLTAIDGFVLSRIDGHSSTAEIIAMTGLERDQVLQILGKLVQFGAIRFRGEPLSSKPPNSLPPRTPAPRSASLPPLSTVPPRRRPSHGHTPRKLFSESPIAAPAPDMRSFSPRPRASTPTQGRTPVPTSGRSNQDASPSGHPSTPHASLSSITIATKPPSANEPPEDSIPVPEWDAAAAEPRSPFQRS